MSKQELLKAIHNAKELLTKYEWSINNSHIPEYWYSIDAKKEGIDLEKFK